MKYSTVKEVLMLASILMFLVSVGLGLYSDVDRDSVIMFMGISIVCVIATVFLVVEEIKNPNK